MAMFSTLKFSETGETQVLKTTDNPKDFQQNKHEACKRCHEKKLKCNGAKNGCERCASSGHLCEYSRSKTRHAKRNKMPDSHSAYRSRYEHSGDRRPEASSAHNTSSSSSSRTSTWKGSRREAVSASGGNVPSTGSSEDYGNGVGDYHIGKTYDAYEMASTTMTMHSGYPSISAEQYPAYAGDYYHEWGTSGVPTSTAPPTYGGAPDTFFGHNDIAYSDYSQHGTYGAWPDDSGF